MQDYHIPAASVCIEYEIKRSQFIANIGHTASKADALGFIKTISAQYADARHNCWAYIAGHPIESIERASSDAGEPSGTAGKPMLNVLQHKHVGEITVVVSRYFGGIKLGAGGLVRAYSTSVQMAMDALTLKQVIAMIPAKISFPFALENQIRHLLEMHNVEICHVSYAEQAKMTLLVPLNIKNTLKSIISDKTHGKVNIIYSMSLPSD
ncbi:MAG: YigZ family protein [Mariprofundaceae bacterium]|nr:YigZ family protein [Mariprofundaceae bacterium]